jgi:uncharacterized membrane protein
MTGSTTVLIVTVMAASAVEAVEALTIILASGITRGWRSTWEGTFLALIALGAVVGLLGTTIIQHVDINILRVVVGTLLLIFGLQWLTKAVLRASGFKALHDEAKLYEKHVAELKAEKGLMKGKRDSLAFVISFKGVFLEGMEVIMIVISFGLANQSAPGDFTGLKYAAIGAGIAIAIIAIAGAIVAKPLAKVPENTLKLGVGILLVTFGLFWMGEGAFNILPAAGAAEGAWPLADWFLLIIAAIVATTTFSLIYYFKQLHKSITQESRAR